MVEQQKSFDMLKDIISQEMDAVMADGARSCDYCPGRIISLMCQHKKIKTLDFLVNIGRMWCKNILLEHEELLK